MPHVAKLLAVDIGNNGIKIGLFEEVDETVRPTPSRILRLPTTSSAFDELRGWLPAESLDWHVATVHRAAERKLAAWAAAERTADRYRLLTNADLPVVARVDYPERVGSDRLLAAIAVNHLRDPNRPAIIIDAGSAITVDLVASDGAFEGGVILPGFQMVAKALARETDQLPQVGGSLDEVPVVVGKSTEAAIHSGLYWGNVGAVRELIFRMVAELAVQPQVFVAGGDAAKLAKHIDPQAQVVPELVFLGIAIARMHR